MFTKEEQEILLFKEIDRQSKIPSPLVIQEDITPVQNKLQEIQNVSSRRNSS